ncbi:O-methyltransferase domain protein [Anaeromyces robustus]|uniref:O-methyltransferase domain protein n=1 Tax=Anaeromyces robustus TaxID=1754192 RepID=A0A1Y1XGE7_9FUNG|nr:O-methyltransferase domain protein [Anaeromyces robustus]|eukprot:ORX84815.1 O-methyltransferase domain protein [Anaeromyces robustus]
MSKIELGEVQETLLIPLYCRAIESKKKNPKIKDEEAVQLIDKIDYDFSKFKQGKGSMVGIVARTSILDRETQNFINNYPDAIVICIGCGLCTRYKRLDLKNVYWYNLDFPDVIDTRNRLLSKNNENDPIFNIAKSCLDDTWPKDIKELNDNKKDILIIIEGVLMFFTEDEVKHLINIIKTNFIHQKVTIFAEIMHTIPSKFTKFHDTVNKTNATFKWGIRHAKDIEKLDSDIKYIEEWHYYDEFSFDDSALCHTLGKIPGMKNISNKIAHLEINPSN